jgi:hypothetical protein
MEKYESNNAWIDPDGNLIPVGYMCHNEWAMDYFKEQEGDFFESKLKIKEITGSSFSYPYEALHKLGWVRLLTWSDEKTKLLGNTYDISVTDNTIDPSLNDKQLLTILEWCEVNNFKFLNLFKP